MSVSNADRQRAYRDRRNTLRNENSDILLKILVELASLRNEITKLRYDSRARAREENTTFHTSNLKPESVSTVRSGRKATRLPTDWNPSISDSDYAVRRGLDPDAVAERFRNYWLAKAGKDATKLDWSRTWQNWCITESERKPAHVNGSNVFNPSPEIAAARDQTRAELRAKGISFLEAP